MFEKMSERRDRRLVSAWLALLAVETAAIVLLAIAGTAGRSQEGASRTTGRVLVQELRLTDLALWSEASYCRHPSQADLFAPHAVHPAAPEAFPAGSFVPPPRQWEALRAEAGFRGPEPRGSAPTPHRSKSAPRRQGGGP